MSVAAMAPGLGVGANLARIGRHADEAAGDGGQTLFRIITEPAPSANVMSNAEKGLPPRGPEKSNPAIHGGLSMFDTLEGAAARIPVLEKGGHTVYGIGEFVPQVGVSVEKTLGPGHYTVSGSSDALMQSWVKSLIDW